jgi:TolA-binding protein
MPERTQKLDVSEKAVRIIVGVVTVLVIIFGFAFDGRLTGTQTKIEAVDSDLQDHKANTSIHRTAEESAARDNSENARWTQLFRELEQINKRIDNLEQRSR